MKNSYTKQFKDSECKYDMIKDFQIQIQMLGDVRLIFTVRSAWKFTFQFSWPLPNPSLTLNLKIFQEV